jgi:RHS repeat-associated protein
MKNFIRLFAVLMLLVCKAALADVTFVHTDVLGSPVAETNSAGQLVRLSHYKPFGEELEQKKDDVAYTGHKYDAALELIYMQARYYDPVIGRFYSNDPKDAMSFLSEGKIQGFNRYAYAANNPYKYVDPDGKNWALAPEAAVAGTFVCGPVCGGIAGLAVGIGGSYLTIKAINHYNESAEDSVKEKITGLVGENPTSEDLQNAPGEGWEWKGNPNAPVGSAQGGWVNPETGEQIHNDLDTHQEGTKRGPHVTYTDQDGKRWDYFPKEDKIEQQ